MVVLLLLFPPATPSSEQHGFLSQTRGESLGNQPNEVLITNIRPTSRLDIAWTPTGPRISKLADADALSDATALKSHAFHKKCLKIVYPCFTVKIHHHNKILHVYRFTVLSNKPRYDVFLKENKKSDDVKF